MPPNIYGYAILTYIAVSYVAAIYISTEKSDKYRLRKDDPVIIKQRMRRLTIMTLVNLTVLQLLQINLSKGPRNTLRNFGLIPGYYMDGTWDIRQYVVDIAKVLFLGVLLYIGPLLDSLLLHYFRRTKLRDIVRGLTENNIWAFRNNVFAPITEELFYTSMLLTTYLHSFPTEGLSYKRLLWEPSIFFGIAHLHHAYETYLAGQYDVLNIMLSTSFQFLYTTLFGAFTNFVFLRTGGNLWACILAHSFCNIMGFPGPSELVLHFTIIEKSEDARLNRFVEFWNRCYKGLLVLGAVLFFMNLKPLVSVSRHTVLL